MCDWSFDPMTANGVRMQVDAPETMAGAGQADDRVRQPSGLHLLVVVEGLERMAFYGMQSLLVLYMAKALLPHGNFDDTLLLPQLNAVFRKPDIAALSSAIFGLFAGLLHAAPLIGGVVSDRLIGRRRSIKLGGLVMSAGYFLLAWNYAFLLGLACIIVGSGMFKGNITSQLGALYPDDDRRRSDGYQMFILSASVGGIAAPILIGSIGENISWQWGFATAGIAMAAGTAIYSAVSGRLPADRMPEQTTLRGGGSEPEANKRGPVMQILMLATILSVLLVPNFQIFNTYMLWGDATFDLAVAGWRIPTSWLIMVDAVVSILAIAGSLRFWNWWRRFHPEPDDFAKIIIGCSLVAGGMLILALAAETVPPGGKINLLFPLLFHLVNAIGYVQIVPVVLSAFSRLAPSGLEGTVMGLFYLSFAAANVLTGWIGGGYVPTEVTRFWLFHAALMAAGAVGLLILRWRAAIQARRSGGGQQKMDKG
jgi:POT family proton-dependent oligopeptide transporter